MENLTLFRISEIEEENYICGLVRLAKKLPEYEIFFHINSKNNFQFKKTADLVVEGRFYTHYHSVFSGYSAESQSFFHFFSNESTFTEKIKDPTELFSTENEKNFLLPEKPDVDYIVKSSDCFPNFSVISLPENILFQIQNYPLESGGKLHSLLQYYE